MDNLPTPEDICLGFTEKTDFSIFLKYPDLDFDPESQKMDGPGPIVHCSSPIHDHVDDGPGPALAFPSPISEHRDQDDTDSASKSNSTPHTTSSRLGAFEEGAPASNEYQDYLTQLRATDLPDAAIYYYRSLAIQILHIAVHVQPRALYPSTNTTTNVLQDSSCLLFQLQQSISVVINQISGIDHITSLAPFTSTPTDLALYPIYQQRASLIIAHLSLPSSTEHELLSSLLTLYDAYVYSPYLHLHRHHFSSVCSSRINDLYNVLNTLINVYSSWLRSTLHLKENYITPLLRRIHDSTWVRTEIEQMEDAVEACNRMNAKPITEVMRPEVSEEQVDDLEKLSERRRTKSSMAVKERRRAAVRAQLQGTTRVRREHTL